LPDKEKALVVDSAEEKKEKEGGEWTSLRRWRRGGHVGRASTPFSLKVRKRETKKKKV